MKTKKTIAIIALVVALFGCGPAASVGAQSTQNNEFKLEMAIIGGDSNEG